MTLEFRPSDPRSVGVELELQILAIDTGDLCDGIAPLLEAMADVPWVKSEFIQNTVEIASMPCMNLWTLELHMREVLTRLLATAKRLGLGLCGAGTHPFSCQFARITPTPRFQEMEKLGGVQAHTQITFATHVHVGVRSGAEAIRLMRELAAYLPVLVAISANSPFWRDYETGYVAYRQILLAASRSYGIPPTFDDWQQFERFFATAQRAKVLRCLRDIHWDIRPRPDFGTLEVRVMDAQSTLSETLAIAAFVRALVAYLRTGERSESVPLPRPLPRWLAKENKFQASRRGLRARYIADADGRVERLADVIEATLEAVRPVAQALGDDLYFEQACGLARAPGYVRQLRAFALRQSTADVVTTLVDTLVDTLAG